jgi:hypothetical protein
MYRDELNMRTNVVWRSWVDGSTNAAYERRIQINDSIFRYARYPDVAQQQLEAQTQQLIERDRIRLRQGIDTDLQRQQQFIAIDWQREVEGRMESLLGEPAYATRASDHAQDADRFMPAYEIEMMQRRADAQSRDVLELERATLHFQQQMRAHGLIEPDELPSDLSDNYKKVQENRKQAEVKAKKLLGSLIGEDELAVYDETKRLFVRGEKYDYIVPADGFIKQIRKDKVIDLCVHLKDRERMPATDNVIALKLMLEHEEEKVLDMANKHGEHHRSTIVGLKVACAGGI